MIATIYEKSRDNRFWITLAIFSLLMALGIYSLVYWGAYSLTPFGLWRRPARILVLFVFSIAVLAGKGMDILSADNKLPDNNSRHSVIYWIRRMLIGLGIIGFVNVVLNIIIKQNSEGVRNFIKGLIKYSPFSGMSDSRFEKAVIHFEYLIRTKLTFDLSGTVLLLAIISIIIGFYVIYMWEQKRFASKHVRMIFIGIVLFDMASIHIQWRIPNENINDPDEFFEEHPFVSRVKKDIESPRTFIKGPLYPFYLDDVVRENQALVSKFRDVGGYSVFLLRRYANFIKAVNKMPLEEYVNPALLRIRNQNSRLLNTQGSIYQEPSRARIWQV